jgi:hypothetical protein
VLPSKGQSQQSPTQSIQQRKPPLAAERRRNLGIHARNSAVPTASGNAHSSAGDPSLVETASTEEGRRKKVARNQKVPPDRSEGTFKVVRTAGLEPAHLTALPPQGSASANFATCALCRSISELNSRSVTIADSVWHLFSSFARSVLPTTNRWSGR